MPYTIPPIAYCAESRELGCQVSSFAPGISLPSGIKTFKVDKGCSGHAAPYKIIYKARLPKVAYVYGDPHLHPVQPHRLTSDEGGIARNLLAPATWVAEEAIHHHIRSEV